MYHRSFAYQAWSVGRGGKRRLAERRAGVGDAGLLTFAHFCGWRLAWIMEIGGGQPGEGARWSPPTSAYVPDGHPWSDVHSHHRCPQDTSLEPRPGTPLPLVRDEAANPVPRILLLQVGPRSVRGGCTNENGALMRSARYRGGWWASVPISQSKATVGCALAGGALDMPFARWPYPVSPPSHRSKHFRPAARAPRGRPLPAAAVRARPARGARPGGGAAGAAGRAGKQAGGNR